ncbi:MAG: hypothetical protein RLY31_1271 [Bacteroidota bacterium]|jgi:uncharacterized membrane protein
MVDFFSEQEEQRIIDAIRGAERRTAGEIRVHLEKSARGDITEAARRTFHRLGMDRTEQRNGVLIFMVPAQHVFAIWGDEGLHRLVPPHFWEDVRDVMQQHFRQSRFAEGICRGIDLAGEKMAAHFPPVEGDRNELPDEISFGE